LAGTGLSINPNTGIISGTPSAAGTIAVALTATNLTGPGAVANLSIQILAEPRRSIRNTIFCIAFADGSVTNDGLILMAILRGLMETFTLQRLPAGFTARRWGRRKDIKPGERLPFCSFDTAVSGLEDPNQSHPVCGWQFLRHDTEHRHGRPRRLSDISNRTIQYHPQFLQHCL